MLSAERFGRERRPAAVDAVDQDHVRVGIPSYVDDGDAAFKARYFFAELVRATDFSQPATLRPDRFMGRCACPAVFVIDGSLSQVLCRTLARAASLGSVQTAATLLYAILKCVLCLQAKDVRNSVDLQRAASDVSPADSIKAGSGGSGGGGSDRMAMRRAGSRPLQGALMPTVPPALEGLELGPIVGKGSYGSVYRGCYQQQHVAVKVRSHASVACSAPASICS